MSSTRTVARARPNPVDRLIDDIEANALPAVTWVTPQFELSDHPPASSSFAHNWLTDIVNAVMKGDMWEHTAIFITWDEWGGFYDSVLPPARSTRSGSGSACPLLTISPYTRRGLIDDELGEFSYAAPVHLRQLGARLPHAPDREDAQLRARLRLQGSPARAVAECDEGQDLWTPVRLHPRGLPGLAARTRSRRTTSLREGVLPGPRPRARALRARADRRPEPSGTTTTNRCWWSFRRRDRSNITLIPALST